MPRAHCAMRACVDAWDAVPACPSFFAVTLFQPFRFPMAFHPPLVARKKVLRFLPTVVLAPVRTMMAPFESISPAAPVSEAPVAPPTPFPPVDAAAPSSCATPLAPAAALLGKNSVQYWRVCIYV